MNRFSNLPELMVAPNGARKSKKDHPNLPITISEIVEESDNCFKCGVNAIHAHVRDKNGCHSLDTGLYNELIKELKVKVPDLPVQITTEAVGKYSPNEQFEVVKKLLPESASVAFIEMLPDIKDYKLAKKFYEFSIDNNIQVQHILYSVKDLKLFIQAIKSKIISNNNLQVLYVLGRYDKNFQSRTEDLDLFIQEHKSILSFIEWGICAFGEAETDCLMKSFTFGGKARVGFENNFQNADGTIAETNADRVSEIVKLRKAIL
tara:strand:+ start:202 stop:987 length:786 start_codon:yes stop_codon:yes gene_type:complete